MPISLGGGANPDKLYLNGHYHSAAYLGSELVWRKKLNPPTLAANGEWYKSAQAKDTITRITICGKYTPAGLPDEMWDASAKQDGSITVYRYGTELIMAGNGAERIYANASCINAFRGFKSCAAFDGLSALDTSQVTTMYGLFQSDSSLTTLDVSEWDTSRVTNMKEMFLGCSSLTTLDVSKWDTAQVKELGFAFRGCSSLTMLDVSKWDTSRVTNMYSTFFGCSSLTELDVSKWDTAQVTNMYGLFRDCASLTTLDVSKWDTAQVTNMYTMFFGCSSLAVLDMAKWDTTQVTNMSNVFYETNRLSSVILGSKFTFIGTDGHLPAPSASYISGADGKWYDTTDGVGYTPAELAAVVRSEPRTYVAVKPES